VTKPTFRVPAVSGVSREARPTVTGTERAGGSRAHGERAARSDSSPEATQLPLSLSDFTAPGSLGAPPRDALRP